MNGHRNFSSRTGGERGREEGKEGGKEGETKFAHTPHTISRIVKTPVYVRGRIYIGAVLIYFMCTRECARVH